VETDKWAPQKIKFQTLIESNNSVIGSKEIDTKVVKLQEKYHR
jgi:hypothetical protein